MRKIYFPIGKDYFVCKAVGSGCSESCITIFGKDNGDNIELTKEDIGVVMDEVGIPECLTVKQIENVMKHTFHNWDNTEYFRLVQKFALPDKKQFKEFSRGMKMKLGIAIALRRKGFVIS